MANALMKNEMSDDALEKVMKELESLKYSNKDNGVNQSYKYLDDRALYSSE